MNTVLLLMTQYESPVIPLKEIHEAYFGIKTHEEAAKKAIHNDLPIPAMKLGGRKSPWLVNIVDLAAHIDKITDEQRKRWAKINAANDE